MDMNGKDLVKLLQRNGWNVERIESSHYIMKKGNNTVSVPVHGSKSLKKGLLNALLKETG